MQRVLGLLGFCLLLAGCALPAAMRVPDAFVRPPEQLGEFGIVALHIADPMFATAAVYVDGVNKTVGTARDGFLYAPIAPGHHTLFRIAYSTSNGSMITTHSQTMTVPFLVEARKVSYLGTLESMSFDSADRNKKTIFMVRTRDMLRSSLTQQGSPLGASLRDEDILDASPSYLDGKELDALRRYMAAEYWRAGNNLDLYAGRHGTLAWPDIKNKSIRLIDAGTLETLSPFRQIERHPAPATSRLVYGNSGRLLRVDQDKATAISYTGALKPKNYFTWRQHAFITSPEGDFAMSSDNGATWKDVITTIGVDKETGRRRETATWFFGKGSGDAIVFGPLVGGLASSKAVDEGYLLAADGSIKRIPWLRGMEATSSVYEVKGQMVSWHDAMIGYDYLMVLPDPAAAAWEKRPHPAYGCRTQITENGGLQMHSCNNGITYESTDMGITWQTTAAPPPASP